MADANAIIRELLRANLNGQLATPLNPPPLPPTRGRHHPSRPAPSPF